MATAVTPPMELIACNKIRSRRLVRVDFLVNCRSKLPQRIIVGAIHGPSIVAIDIYAKTDVESIVKIVPVMITKKFIVFLLILSL